MQRSHQTDALSGKYSLTELHLIHSVVNHHLQVIYLNNLIPQMRQHGEGEITVCNGTLKRTFGLGAFCVNVNPLMVQRCVGKEIDAFLRKFHILRNTDLLTYQLFKILVRIDNNFFHIFFVLLGKCVVNGNKDTAYLRINYKRIIKKPYFSGCCYGNYSHYYPYHSSK